MRGLVRSCLSLPMVALVSMGPGCDSGEEDSTSSTIPMSDTGIPVPTGGQATESADGQGEGDDAEKLDVLGGTGELPCAEEGGDCGQCEPSEHVPCDDAADSMIFAMGLNCPGDSEVEVMTSGSPAAMAVRTGFGPTATWAPREGSAFAVLGSGFVSDLDMETPDSDAAFPNEHRTPTHCNDDLGDFDPGGTLPAPLMTNDVTGDCAADPSLLGTGDCSNTIQGQFSQGSSANDYTEVRIIADVPMTNNSVNYDFAFFSTEYPYYFGSAFNDMYVGWLESESWTGNISFDNAGNPISLNAGFLDFTDDAGAEPAFAGTCMKYHAGTQWLQSIAPVTPGETITLVLAVFDLSDSILDSYVFIDNFGWGCDGEDTPTTNPVG